MPSSDNVTENSVESDIICLILNGPPFKLRNEKEKINILRNGRPLPNFTTPKNSILTDSRVSPTNWYALYKWLCGSSTLKKFFCWPCVLMRPESSSWSSTGNDESKRFSALAEKHGVCKSHLKAISEYDATLINFSLPPEFTNNSNNQSKEEINLSDKTNAEILSNDLKNENDNNSVNSKYNDLENHAEKKIKDNSTLKKKIEKKKNKISFKTWQELYKDIYFTSKTKSFEDLKLFKLKRKIAKQELRNSRLTYQKLKMEIEVLTAKAEYYKSLK